jgi:hypothetical protein
MWEMYKKENSLFWEGKGSVKNGISAVKKQFFVRLSLENTCLRQFLAKLRVILFYN